MAGDWIKMECSTPDKPEVLAITVKMGWDDPDLAVGKLFKLWRWFDQHTTDGNAAGVTSALLDRYFGVTGFVTAVASVGWLVIDETGISLPNFSKHNGATAKQRSQTAKRVANHKSNAKGNADTVTEALPREEKRREEKKERNTKTPAIAAPDGVPDSVWADFVQLRKDKKAKLTKTALDGIAAEAVKAGWSLDAALRECCARGWTGFKAHWVAEKPAISSTQQPLNKQQALEQRNRAVADQWLRDQEQQDATH